MIILGSLNPTKLTKREIDFVFFINLLKQEKYFFRLSKRSQELKLLKLVS